MGHTTCVVNLQSHKLTCFIVLHQVAHDSISVIVIDQEQLVIGNTRGSGACDHVCIGGGCVSGRGTDIAGFLACMLRWQ